MYVCMMYIKVVKRIIGQWLHATATAFFGAWAQAVEASKVTKGILNLPPSLSLPPILPLSVSLLPLSPSLCQTTTFREEGQINQCLFVFACAGKRCVLHVSRAFSVYARTHPPYTMHAANRPRTHARTRPPNYQRINPPTHKTFSLSRLSLSLYLSLTHKQVLIWISL
jgi:hypothetical protein